MKYAITHCYTDRNKGDAAIIIATTQLLRDTDPDAHIAMFSTFGPRDTRFLHEHRMIRPYGDALYPGLFYQPEPRSSAKLEWLRLIPFLGMCIKAALLLISSHPWFTRLFLSSIERQGVRAILEVDLIVSKGGSYLTTANAGVRQSLSLIALLYPFVFAKRYGKRIVIFSQSLGPVTGRFNRWMFRVALANIGTIYLREPDCLAHYEEVGQLRGHADFRIIPDTAFYLQEDRIVEQPLGLLPGFLNVGFTLVDHAFPGVSTARERRRRRAAYKSSIIACMEHLLAEKNAFVHIFPQVMIPDSRLGNDDVRMAEEIVAHFADSSYASRVKFHAGDHTPMALRHMYGQMDLLVGTRLHSVIFALSKNVPCVNIAYHGTKSQGILGSIEEVNTLVVGIDQIMPETLIQLVDSALSSSATISKQLESTNQRLRSELRAAMSDLVGSTGNGAVA